MLTLSGVSTPYSNIRLLGGTILKAEEIGLIVGHATIFGSATPTETSSFPLLKLVPKR